MRYCCCRFGNEGFAWSCCQSLHRRSQKERERSNDRPRHVRVQHFVRRIGHRHTRDRKSITLRVPTLQQELKLLELLGSSFFLMSLYIQRSERSCRSRNNCILNQKSNTLKP